MLQKSGKILVIGAVLFLIASTTYSLGFTEGQNSPKTILVKGLANLEENKPEEVDFGTFWQAWEIINQDYLRQDETKDQAKVYGAIQGLVHSLDDPNSEFFTPEENQRFEEDVQGNFGGIGAEIGIREGRLTIIAPLKNSPALKAGLAAGDFVVKINETSTERLQLNEAINLIRGPENTSVTLSVFRESWSEIKDITITRQIIEIPTVDIKILEDHIAHVEFLSFNGNANQLFFKAMSETLSKDGVKGIVLDLRNNPGGFLEIAVDMAGWFVDSGKVIVTEKGLDHETAYKSRGNGALKEIPLVILINKGSASASEILAGALRHHKQTPLIGETTFGKGTVQQLKELRDGSSIKLTIAHWVLPDGTIIEKNGIKPDFEVTLTEEDQKNNKDPQLEKAISIIKEKTDTLFQSS
ncbi:MAG: S41 family peptidase [Anaplasmataceae bacterium]|nr:S41 family peptidase [Anaplasmataceae bacterium]